MWLSFCPSPRCLDIKEDTMNDETKKRTLLRALTSAGVAVAVWQFVFKALYEQLGEVWIAAVVATIITAFVLAVDAYTTYKNNDYTEAGAIGTSVTRRIKEDPTLVVDMYDGVADDDEAFEEEEEDDNSEEAEE